MLNWNNIIRFLKQMVEITKDPPTIWGEEEQQKLREELDALLCGLGRHDYEFKLLNSEGVVLRCFYCGHEKLCLLRGDR